MLGKGILAILCLMLGHQVVVEAQLEASNWVFGGFGGVNFSCSVPQIFPTPFDGLEGGASISSASGELLFFTNGDAVWNKESFGLCLTEGKLVESAPGTLVRRPPKAPLSFRIPATPLYTICLPPIALKIISRMVFDTPVINMSMNGGFGDVIEKNKPLASFAAEKIAHIQPNGTDVWVVTHGVLSNAFYAYSITSAGLNPVPVISNTGQVHPGGRGYMKFSPDGKRLVATCFKYELDDGTNTELFAFDSNTGAVTADFILPTTSKSDYAASFSPNGKILYTSCSWACTPTIEQFNLEAGTPQQIVDQRFTIQAPRIYGALQLGIDGKLHYLSYDSNTGINYLSMIESPHR